MDFGVENAMDPAVLCREQGNPSKAKGHLPDPKKQYLITRNGAGLYFRSEGKNWPWLGWRGGGPIC